MKATADNCCVLLSASNGLTVKINGVQIKNCLFEKLLGITIDNDLKFEDHINNICRKANAKLSAFSRKAPHRDLPKRKQIINAQFKSQVRWSPVTMIWVGLLGVCFEMGVGCKTITCLKLVRIMLET